jgi:hypothetical protein
MGEAFITYSMTITAKQAELIGKKCYITTANQKHCEKWCFDNLSSDQASKILRRVLTVNYDMCMKRPDEAAEITKWGREQLYALGYQEKELSKSL